MKTFFIKTNNLISWECRHLYKYLDYIAILEEEPNFNNLMLYLELYDPRIDFQNQCSGYKKIVQMLNENVIPATKSEYDSFINDKRKPVKLKYLFFIHPNLRNIIRKNWDLIVKLYKEQYHD